MCHRRGFKRESTAATVFDPRWIGYRLGWLLAHRWQIIAKQRWQMISKPPALLFQRVASRTAMALSHCYTSLESLLKAKWQRMRPLKTPAISTHVYEIHSGSKSRSLAPFACGVATTARTSSSESSISQCDPNGIRTRVTAVKGRCPGPLDDRVIRQLPDGQYRNSILPRKVNCRTVANLAPRAN